MAIVDPDLSDVHQPPPRQEVPPSALVVDPDLTEFHPPAPPREEGTFERPTRVMGHVNKGLTKIPGIVMDPLKMLAGFAGLDDYVPGSQDIEHVLKAIGAINPISDKPAETLGGRVMDQAAELGGESVGIGGPLRSMLRYGAEKVINPVARNVMKEIGGSGTISGEIKNVLADLGLGGISGAGGEVVAQNAGEKYRGLGQLGSGLSPLAAMLPVQLARRLLPPVGRQSQERAALELLHPDLADPHSSAREMLGLRLKDAQRDAADIPGYTPTTGALLDDPTILGQERALTVSDPAAREEALRLRRHNQGAMADSLAEAAPAGDPEAPRRAASARVQVFRDKVKARREALRGQAQQAAGDETSRAQTQLDEAQAAFHEADQAAGRVPLTADQTAEQASRSVAEGLTAAEKVADERAKKLFGEVDKEAEVSLYPLRKAQEEVHAQAKERGREDAIPGIMRAPKDDEGRTFGKYLDDYFTPPGEPAGSKKFLPKLPVSQLQGLRSRLTTARRQLREAGGDEQEQAFLSRLIQGVDDTLAEAPETNVSGPYKIARDYFRENVAGPFRDNTVSKIIRGDVPPTEAAGQVFKPGERGAAAADELMKAAGGQGQQLVRDYAVQKALAFAVDKNGRIDPAKLRVFNQKYAPALERFPAVQSELADAQAMQAAAKDTATAAQERVAAAEGVVKEAGQSGAQSVRAAEARGARLGQRSEAAVQNQHAAMVLDSDPHKMITTIRNSKDPTEALTKVGQLIKKDPEAQAGLARAYWDNLMSRVTSNVEGDPVRSAGLNRLLKDPKEVAMQQALLTPGQRFRLGQVLKAAQTEQRAVSTRATRGDSGTAENYAGTRLLEHGLRGVLGGPIGSGISAVLQAMKLAPTRDNVLSIYREAMLDPKAMEALLTRVNRQGAPQPMAYQQLLNLQARLRPDPYQDPDKEKPNAPQRN